MPNRRKVYKRFCKRCGELYTPTGKFQKFCYDCVDPQAKLILKEKAKKLKIKFKDLSP